MQKIIYKLDTDSPTFLHQIINVFEVETVDINFCLYSTDWAGKQLNS